MSLRSYYAGLAGLLTTTTPPIDPGPVGLQLPSLNWLGAFWDGNTTSQRGPASTLQAVSAGSTPTLLANGIGGRPAWHYKEEDKWAWTINNPQAQHWLVAFVLQPAAFDTYGAVMLGTNQNGNTFWMCGADPQNWYTQSTQFPVPGLVTSMAYTVVYYVENGQAKVLLNGDLNEGPMNPSPVPAGQLPLWIGAWQGGNQWDFQGLLPSCLVAAGQHTTTQAMQVQTALKTYYSIS